MAKWTVLLSMVLIASCVGGVGFLMTAPSRRPPFVPPAPAVMPLTNTEMRQCSECHQEATDAFLDSPHARTAAKGTEAHVLEAFAGKEHEGVPPHGGVRFEAEPLEGGRQQLVARSLDGEKSAVIDWVLGSGRGGYTAVSLIDEDDGQGTAALREIHYSAYRSGSEDGEYTLDRTIGHIMKRGNELGVVHFGEAASNCIECHGRGMTRSFSEERTPEPRFHTEVFAGGLGCDNCHTGSREHVRSGGESEVSLAFSAKTARDEVLFCMKCHRTSKTTSNLDRTKPSVARFQAAALMRSECFDPGPDGFSCTVCHDPHQEGYADQVRLASHQACARCHAAEEANVAAGSACGRGESAPVESAQCIDCHMPRVVVDEVSPLVDHWIRVRDMRDPRPAPKDWERRAPSVETAAAE